MQIRPLTKHDFDRLLDVIDDWWQAPVRHLLHPTALYQFGDTAFAAEDGGELCGFVAGFISQTDPSEAYIHLVAAAPVHRRMGVARALYEHFFAVVVGRGCRRVKAITRPANRASLTFHLRLGFELVEDSSVEVDGVMVVPDYSGPGQHRVVLVKALPGR